MHVTDLPDPGTRLARLRGGAPACAHNARTIAAFTSNPGCVRRGLMDAAGVDKAEVATRLGFAPRFGQSRFALTRGNVFEAQVKADGCAELLTLLRDRLGLPVPEVAYDDLGAVGADEDDEARHARTRRLLRRAASADGGTLFDHPLLRLDIAGQPAYLEPDVIAFQLSGRFHVIMIKSFAVIDGQADPEQVAAAARQSAVYVLALRELLHEMDLDPGLAGHDVILVCPENFSNRPTATFVDVRRQLAVLRRQLARVTRAEDALAELPAGLGFGAGPGLDRAVRSVQARYSPDCLSACELALFCRDEARACGSTDALGRAVRDELGGIGTIGTALALADGSLEPAADQAEGAAWLRTAARLRREALGPRA